MKKYSDIEVTGSLTITGSLVVDGVAEITASHATSASLSDTTSQINDEGSSGYIDIGSVRYQWGTQTGGGTVTITLPAPFANDTYSITSNLLSNRSDIGYSTVHHTLTTTTFELIKVFLNVNADAGFRLFGDGSPVQWIAIGLKP